jgi:hypothetical protein
VDYDALGAHRVTTIYTSGSDSATVTETKTIEPLATTSTLSASYETLPVSEQTNKDWRIGTLTVAGGVQPAAAGSLGLGCRDSEGPACLTVMGASSLGGPAEIPVDGKQCGAHQTRSPPGRRNRSAKQRSTPFPWAVAAPKSSGGPSRTSKPGPTSCEPHRHLGGRLRGLGSDGVSPVHPGGQLPGPR